MLKQKKNSKIKIAVNLITLFFLSVNHTKKINKITRFRCECIILKV